MVAGAVAVTGVAVGQAGTQANTTTEEVDTTQGASLSLALSTTRGDALTGDSTPNYAAGQDIQATIQYSGLPGDGGEIELVDSDLLGDDSIDRMSVSESSGEVTVEITYETLSELSSDPIEAGGPDIEAQWVRNGNVETRSDQITVVEADTTIYIASAPSEVGVGESATVRVYGWSTYEFVNAELYHDEGLFNDEFLDHNPEIGANPYFEGEITFTPPEDVSVGDTLEVFADSNKDDTSPRSRTVPIQVVAGSNAAPTAEFSYTPEGPSVGDTVTFDASASADEDGSIASYQWDLDGDGSVETTGETVTHAFDSVGSYDVRLTVTDGDGARDNSTATIDVAFDTGSSLELPDSPETRFSTPITISTRDTGTAQVTASVLLLRTAIDEARLASATDGVEGVSLSSADPAELPDLPDGASFIAGYTVDAIGNGQGTIEVPAETDTPAVYTLQGETWTRQHGFVDGETITIDFSAPADGVAVAVAQGPGDRTGSDPVVVGDRPASDVDGDGAYEDVNGDGEATATDVQALFANRDSAAIRNDPDAFDFNGDRSFSISDVQALFSELF